MFRHAAALLFLEHFQFETLRVSNHTAWRFAEKTRFFRSLWAGRRCAAASRSPFSKVKRSKAFFFWSALAGMPEKGEKRRLRRALQKFFREAD
ncbi:hypothetical protein QUW15_04255 [Desulfovibrio piger]|nr:hypothetical protein [Desulfovibrio piger]